MNAIIYPLLENFPSLSLTFEIKTDKHNIFHARWLITDQATILVERGFDLFRRNGEFKENIFHIVDMSQQDVQHHLASCRQLPKFRFWDSQKAVKK